MEPHLESWTPERFVALFAGHIRHQIKSSICTACLPQEPRELDDEAIGRPPDLIIEHAGGHGRGSRSRLTDGWRASGPTPDLQGNDLRTYETARKCIRYGHVAC